MLRIVVFWYSSPLELRKDRLIEKCSRGSGCGREHVFDRGSFSYSSGNRLSRCMAADKTLRWRRTDLL